MARRTKKTRYRRFFRNMWILLILGSLTLFLVWPYLRDFSLKTLVPVGRGSLEVLEDRVSGEILLLGGVSYLTSPAKGRVSWFLEDGAFVRQGEVLGEIDTGDLSEAYAESLERAMANLEEHRSSWDPRLDHLMCLVERDCQEALLLLTSAGNPQIQTVGSSSFREAEFLEKGAKIREAREEITLILRRRHDLQEKVDLISQAFSGSKVEIRAPLSGTFSKDFFPGEKKLEDSLPPKDGSELSLLVRQVSAQRKNQILEGDKVEAGDLLGRVIHGQKIRFFLSLNTEDKPKGGEGSRVIVRFSPDDFETEGQVVSLTDGKPPGYTVLEGSLELLPHAFVTPYSKVELVFRRQKGIVVPSSAVLIKEGKTGVLALQKTYARFHPVDVLMEVGDYSVLKGVSETQEILFRAKNFWEDRRVR